MAPSGWVSFVGLPCCLIVKVIQPSKDVANQGKCLAIFIQHLELLDEDINKEVMRIV